MTQPRSQKQPKPSCFILFLTVYPFIPDSKCTVATDRFSCVTQYVHNQHIVFVK